jgi:hypothetical protein
LTLAQLHDQCRILPQNLVSALTFDIKQTRKLPNAQKSPSRYLADRHTDSFHSELLLRASKITCTQSHSNKQELVGSIFFLVHKAIAGG